MKGLLELLSCNTDPCFCVAFWRKPFCVTGSFWGSTILHTRKCSEIILISGRDIKATTGRMRDSKPRGYRKMGSSANDNESSILPALKSHIILC